MIYLDSAATTKPEPEVIRAMIPYLAEKWYNPSSLYGKANKVKEDIEKARKIVADYIKAESNEIFFTSGGSESNCWAIQGFVNYWRNKKRTTAVITSVIEHKSIMSCVENIDTSVYYVGVDNEGFVDINSLENILQNVMTEAHEILVSIQFANNEIGTIQHIKEIAKLVHKYDAVFHTDAVQAFGQLPIDVNELGIDMMSVSGHKIGCCKGIGFLYKKSNIDINPIIFGSQMDSLRGGTENVPYIIGMAKAIKIIKRDEEYRLRLTILRKAFISKLKAVGCTVNGSISERLPNNINVTFSQNITGESIIYMLDMNGIYVSSGSACNASSIEPSYVLKAIGLSDEDANKTIRITLPHDITMDDIDKVVCEIEKSIKLLVMDGDFCV